MAKIKKEVLNAISEHLNPCSLRPAIEPIAKVSDGTISNVLQGNWNNENVIQAALDLIEERALEHLKFVTDTRKEIGLKKNNSAAQSLKH